MPDPTDQVLLRQTRRGDEAAARALYARLTPALISFARSILRDECLAEDAVQAAFCRVFRVRTSEVDRVESAGAWLARIVRREALTIMRGHKRMVQRHRRWADGRDPTPALPPPDEAIGSAELHELGARVYALPRRLGEVVVLKHVCALTFDQIAVALKLNRNTAAARYRSAMIRLREALKPKGIVMKEHTRAR